MSKELSHVDQHGRLRMVDVGDKVLSRRIAVAAGRVCMQQTTVAAIRANKLAKGDVLTCAKVAGIAAAKRTSELIPLCHNLVLSWVDVGFELEPDCVLVEATAKAEQVTGVEMEALTAVSVAALTLYDMCKAVDPAMRIECIRLVEKQGGKQPYRENADD